MGAPVAIVFFKNPKRPCASSIGPAVKYKGSDGLTLFAFETGGCYVAHMGGMRGHEVRSGRSLIQHRRWIITVSFKYTKPTGPR